MSSYEDYDAWAAQQSHVSPPYRPSLVYRWSPVPFIALGILSLVMYEFPTSGQVPENELTLVEGVPSDVEVTRRRKQYGSTELLSFAVGGYKTSISEYHPKYESVRSAVQDRSPLKVWLETRKRYSGDSKPLYKVMAGDRTLVSYDDTVQKASKERESLLVGGVALMVAGAFMACLVVFQQQRYDAYAAAQRQAIPED